MTIRYQPSYTSSLLFILFVSLVGYFIYQSLHSTEHREKELVRYIAADLAVLPLQTPVDYNQQIKPLLEQRCVVCHGCYDAPCQLKLSSPDGIQRGATEARVYNPKRIKAAQPTRLYVDARNVAEWRNRGFHPVLAEHASSPQSYLKNSVLYRLLLLKQQHPLPELDALPDSFTLGLEREQRCASIETVNEYVKEHPLWGMPYAMASLSKAEYQSLVTWIAQGSPVPVATPPSTSVLPQVVLWEQFLNQPGNKQRLMSRYLYEHLFHAHIHFSGSPAREFYRLIRSSTPPGQATSEIPTVRPYDDPGMTSFYYRLVRYQPSIVVKSHLVYEFSPKRMTRYRELFLQPDYTVDSLPSYMPEVASNPFKTFRQLPLKSRYRFLLDDSRFFIEGFVKGPVCRGQIALNVIEDQFWVLFFDPEQDVFTNDAQFIGAMADDLQLPADRQSSLNLFSIWTDYWQRQRRYLLTKQALFEKINTHNIQHAMNYIWDGKGASHNNPNAALTVFRHFDSGSVAYGLVGSNPETTWVLDYPLFERIHYLLVAGFNVYGNLVHQVNTRVYMDFLRMEGEDHFLAFLPARQRKSIRDSWYSGLRGNVKTYFTPPEDWLKVESVAGYQTYDPQNELYGYIKRHLMHLTRHSDDINRCGQHFCSQAQSQQTAEVKNRVDKAMEKIAEMRGEKLHALADVSFVRVSADNPEHELAYTLVRNKAYKNVTSFLADEHERDRADVEQDTMTVVNWLEGSYPNFFFSVKLENIEQFAEDCAAIRNHQDYEKFVEKYGVHRTDSNFWSTADWFQRRMARDQPVRAGLFDLNRYQSY